MLSLNDAQKRANDLLVGFPSRVVEAYFTYAKGAEKSNLDIVVLGVLQFYLAKKPDSLLDSMPGSTRLAEDLGCDSLTMMDTIFMVESLFDITLDDGELAKLTTLDALREHLRQQVQGSAAPAS